MYRFKTGTPARIDKNTIDFSKMQEQKGDERVVPFSFTTDPESVQIDQASNTEQTFNLFEFQCTLQLSRINAVILDRIRISHDLRMFQSRYTSVHCILDSLTEVQVMRKQHARDLLPESMPQESVLEKIQ